MPLPVVVAVARGFTIRMVAAEGSRSAIVRMFVPAGRNAFYPPTSFDALRPAAGFEARGLVRLATQGSNASMLAQALDVQSNTAELKDE